MDLAALFWGTRTAKTVTVVGGAFAAVFGAITAAHSAWPIIAPYVPAHRGYVVEQVGAVQATANQLMLWRFEDNKNKIVAERSGWTIQMQKESDPAAKTLMQERVQKLNDEEKHLDERIQKLKGP